MKNFWENVKLGNISSMQYGFTASAKEKEVGPKFLRITDIVKDSINWSTVPYCKINNTNYKKYKIEEGDIVIARTGATAGYAKLIKNPPDAVFASYLIRVKFSQKCIPGFGGKLIESNIFKNFIKQNITGSAQPHANAPILKKFKFLLPPLKIQGKIASILSAYDELIEKNNRRIEILEEMAETIYKEWFVHFRFPGHEKVEMVDSELGKIPEDWEVKPLLSIAKQISRGSSLKYVNEGGVPVLNQRCIRNGRIEFEAIQYAEELPKKSERYYLKMGDILINSMGVGTLGRVARNLNVKNKMIIHNCITFIRTNNDIIDKNILFYRIKDNKKYFEKISIGATGQTSLKLTDIKALKILIPPLEIQSRVTSFFNNISRLIGIYQEKNNDLKKTRDLLLPKLISGKIDVSDLDIKIEEKK